MNMTKHDYKQNAYYIIYLIKCALTNKVPAKEKLDKMDMSLLFQVAEEHSLTAVTAYALESAGVFDKSFSEAKNMGIRRNIIFDAERSSVLAELEKAGIWYLPLKGIILQKYYPYLGLRQMADNDILFDPSKRNEVRDIMEALDFTTVKFGESNHDEYQKPPVLNFEMHNELFLPEYEETIYQYYENVDKRLIKDCDNGFGYHFTDEDFYLYITAHEYKHFIQGGTGLRNLADKYLFLEKHGEHLDKEYIEKELRKMNITKYERESRELTLKIFGGERLSDKEKELLDYYIFSGTYGTVERIVEHRIEKIGGGLSAKAKYFSERFFVPVSKRSEDYEGFAKKYPMFYKYKILLPLLPFYRLFKGLRESRKRIVPEIKTWFKS